MKLNINIAFVLVVAISIVTGCSRSANGDIIIPDILLKQSAPPAFHIQASEKLDIPEEIRLPDNLPSGNSRVATYYAEGVQKYKAVQTGTNPDTYQWAFVAPRADLFDITNKKAGTHGAGPYWEVSPADSIFAQHFNPARTAPSPDGSIDWLLLMPKAGMVPTGVFAQVAYIQRIATRGGKAPSAPPSGIHETADIPYTAVYRLTRINP